MGKSFNVDARVNVSGPHNLTNVMRTLRTSLTSLNTNISVNVSPTARTRIETLGKSLVALNTQLQKTAIMGASAGTGIGALGLSFKAAGVSKDRFIKNLRALHATNKRTATSTQAATGQMASFGKTAGLALRRFAGFTIATTIVFGFLRAVGSPVSEGIKFERQLIKVAQVTGKGIGEFKGLTDEITRLSTTWGVASSDLIEVARTLSQAGLSAKETRIALEALAKSSLAATFTDIKETTEGAIAIMRQFDISANDLEKSLGAINAVAGKFAVESDDIIAAVRRAGGVFAAASKGVSEGKDALNEFIATFTSVRATTREGAETIATGLRTIFTRIQRGTTIKFLEELGIQLQENGKFVGAFKAINRLSTALKDLDPRDVRFSQIVEELGGFRQIGKVIPLLQQMEVRMDALRTAQMGGGSLAEDAITAQQSLSVQLEKTREKFVAMVREITSSSGFKSFITTVLTLANVLIKLGAALSPLIPMLAALGGIKLLKGAGRLMGRGGFLGGLSGGGGVGGGVMAGGMMAGMMGGGRNRLSAVGRRYGTAKAMLTGRSMAGGSKHFIRTRAAGMAGMRGMRGMGGMGMMGGLMAGSAMMGSQNVGVAAGGGGMTGGIMGGMLAGPGGAVAGAGIGALRAGRSAVIRKKEDEAITAVTEATKELEKSFLDLTAAGDTFRTAAHTRGLRATGRAVGASRAAAKPGALGALESFFDPGQASAFALSKPGQATIGQTEAARMQTATSLSFADPETAMGDRWAASIGGQGLGRIGEFLGMKEKGSTVERGATGIFKAQDRQEAFRRRHMREGLAPMTEAATGQIDKMIEEGFGMEEIFKALGPGGIRAAGLATEGRGQVETFMQAEQEGRATGEQATAVAKRALELEYEEKIRAARASRELAEESAEVANVFDDIVGRMREAVAHTTQFDKRIQQISQHSADVVTRGAGGVALGGMVDTTNVFANPRAFSLDRVRQESRGLAGFAGDEFAAQTEGAAIIDRQLKPFLVQTLQDRDKIAGEGEISGQVGREVLGAFSGVVPPALLAAVVDDVQQAPGIKTTRQQAGGTDAIIRTTDFEQTGKKITDEQLAAAAKVKDSIIKAGQAFVKGMETVTKLMLQALDVEAKGADVRAGFIQRARGILAGPGGLSHEQKVQSASDRIDRMATQGGMNLQGGPSFSPEEIRDAIFQKREEVEAAQTRAREAQAAGDTGGFQEAVGEAAQLNLELNRLQKAARMAADDTTELASAEALLRKSFQRAAVSQKTGFAFAGAGREGRRGMVRGAGALAMALGTPHEMDPNLPMENQLNLRRRKRLRERPRGERGPGNFLGQGGGLLGFDRPGQLEAGEQFAGAVEANQRLLDMNAIGQKQFDENQKRLGSEAFRLAKESGLIEQQNQAIMASGGRALTDRQWEGRFQGDPNLFGKKDAETKFLVALAKHEKATDALSDIIVNQVKPVLTDTIAIMGAVNAGLPDLKTATDNLVIASEHLAGVNIPDKIEMSLEASEAIVIRMEGAAILESADSAIQNMVNENVARVVTERIEEIRNAPQ